MPTELSGAELAKLTAIITGGGYKRSKDRAAAEARFIKIATEAGIKNAADIVQGSYDMAEHVIREKIAGKPLTIAEVKAARVPTDDDGMLRVFEPEELDPIEAAFRDYVATDDRSDQWMKDLFRRVFEAGRAAARPARTPRAEGPSKRSIAADLLKQDGGCTARDILNATGWTAVSVPSIARAAGLTLRQEKVGRSTRYFGSMAA